MEYSPLTGRKEKRDRNIVCGSACQADKAGQCSWKDQSDQNIFSSIFAILQPLNSYYLKKLHQYTRLDLKGFQSFFSCSVCFKFVLSMWERGACHLCRQFATFFDEGEIFCCFTATTFPSFPGGGWGGRRKRKLFVCDDRAKKGGIERPLSLSFRKANKTERLKRKKTSPKETEYATVAQKITLSKEREILVGRNL